MSKNGTSIKFRIQSSIDNQKFTVNKKVIDSSLLLKNICEITDTTGDPILVSCPGNSLQLYIKLINSFQTFKEDGHDILFEKNLFDAFTSNDKNKLIKFIQDLCILDSDYFLDSVADYILGILGKMDWDDAQKYLGVEDDFSEKEREYMEKDEKLEYFLSLDTENFKFPFESKNLYSLKTDFSTPLNALIARIVQRSTEKTSYVLSLINKTIKNEVDRHPFKLSKFDAWTDSFLLDLSMNELKRNFSFLLKCDNYDERYFNILMKRKVIAAKCFAHFVAKEGKYIQLNSMDFVISKEIEISFGNSINSMHQFDVKKCPIPSILYSFGTVKEQTVDFENVYNHLIAKDLSKNISIRTYDNFNFFKPRSCLWFHKDTNASKFYEMSLFLPRNIDAKFENFLTKYMQDDGIILCCEKVCGIQSEKLSSRRDCGYEYPVSVFKEYLDVKK